MPLESASNISQLVTSNPPDSDPLGQASAHLRLIKSAVVATFPNVKNPVTTSDTDLNALSGLYSDGTMTLPAPTSPNGSIGAELNLDGVPSGTDLRVYNNAGALVVDDATQATPPVPTNLMSVSAAVASFVAPTDTPQVRQGGNALIPTGIICMWSGASTAIPGGWTLCNGTNGAPDLRDRFIVGAALSYGVGATGGSASVTGTTTQNGSHNHGGLTAVAGSHTHGASTDQQGSHSHGGNTGSHSLTISEMPSHAHGIALDYADPAFQAGNAVSNTRNAQSAGTGTTASSGSGQPHTHPISVDGLHGHNVTVQAAGDHQHGINLDGAHDHSVTIDPRPPFYALCFIMKL